MPLPLLRTVDEARAFAEGARGEGKRLALVPTMGFLHAGHLSLLEEARRRAPAVAVSLFVNPTQFGPQEDLARYPRDLEGDLLKCQAAGVSAAFVPSTQEMYPAGYQTFVEVSELQKGLCGDRRPGHFRGVATVVTKLFTLFRPDLAFFGEKDYQQLQVLTALSRDLNLGVEVVGMPIVRESGGLALSSRNRYLSPSETERARALYRGLCTAQRRFEQGTREAAALVQEVREELTRAEVREDYVELVDARTLMPQERVDPGHPARLLVAGFVGRTRLIDNAPIGR